jgi:uncharacterized protein (TIGR02186 family)
MIRLIALLMTLALPAQAEEIVLGLSRDQVAITATFQGSEIIVFGAIKRDTPVPDDSDLGVIVTIAGPYEPVTVWRKDRRLGIWVNAEAGEIDRAPSFYAVASSAPLADILTPDDDNTHGISVQRAIGAVHGAVADAQAFGDALIRIKTRQNLYQTLENTVQVDQDTLFRTAITLPANLTDGDYTAQIYLTRDGQVVDEYVSQIPVIKVGMERWLYNLAHENAALYGLLSLSIAIAAGWLASAAFGLLRR